MKQAVISGIGITLLLSAGLAAQSQTTANSQSSSDNTSLGTYARQVHKDPGANAKPKVFDNDNLPREDKLSIVGTARTESETANAPKAEEPAAAPAAPSTGEAKSGAESKPATADVKVPVSTGDGEKDEAAKQAAYKQWGDKLAGQKDQIDLLSRELDVAQREYQLRAAQMYADAGNRLRNSSDWDKQDADYKQKIADKQKAIDDAKQRLEDMTEEARKAGVPASVREP
jgi:hypothetical protein